MSYWLGIDVGTTCTAAAICRVQSGRRAVPEVVPLGSRSAAVSSVVYVGQDGQVVVGEAAERRTVTNPDRVVREFMQRIGDEVPMVIGGVPYWASEVAAMVIQWVVDRVVQREGGHAAGIVITHPASWGRYKIQTMADALHAIGLPEIIFRTEPEAAVVSYAFRERVDVGSTIAVYDLGGTTFDAAVVRKTPAGRFSPLGPPESIERLGGADFDDAVFRHVVTNVPGLRDLDSDVAASAETTARLRRSFALCRRECTDGKEALSVDTEVTIPVLFPEIQSNVRLDRGELQDLIRPQLTETVVALCRALQSAEVSPADLDAVLLVGGSSRIPLVAQLVSAELDRPVAVDADPQTATAVGAALSGLATDTAHQVHIDSFDADFTQDPPVPPNAGVTSAAGFAESDAPEPGEADAPDAPLLTASSLDIEAAELEWRQATSPPLKRFAAAGILAVVLGGGVASVLVVTSHSDPVPPAAAETPAPTTPTLPVIATPAPDLRNPSDVRPPSDAAQMTPAAVPSEPATGTTKQWSGKASTPRTTRAANRRPAPPPATTPPPPAHIPQWVADARSW